MGGDVASSPPRCAGCGGPIGVLEAAWLEDADGVLRPSPAVDIDEQARLAARRLWHTGCIRLPDEDD